MSKCGFALLSLFNKIDRMPYFDIRYSLIDIRFFKISFSIKLAVFQGCGNALMKLHQPT
jgi:hypothetical protein